MTTETGSPRSRRALLAAGAAAGVATVASALGRPSQTRATQDEPVLAGQTNTATGSTTVQTSGTIGLRGESSNTGDLTTGVMGLVGASATYNYGVRGQTAGTLGVGVSGWATHETGATIGVRGRSSSSAGTGVYGWAESSSGATRAIFGRTASPDGTAVIGFSATGFADVDPTPVPKTGVYGYAAQDAGSVGVRGFSPAGTGIDARSTSGTGVYAGSESGTGVLANVGATATAALFGNSIGGPGLWAQTDGASAGAIGWSKGSQRTGVLGYSGTDSVPAAPAKTGVYGYATQDASARGVWGRSGSGRGVYGQASSGQGVRGYADTGTALYGATTGLKKGLALRAVGRVKLDNCAGVATINSGNINVTVSPGIDLVSTSAVVATLQGNPAGTVMVRSVAINATDDTFTIYLTATAAANVKVAWHVFG